MKRRHLVIVAILVLLLAVPAVLLHRLLYTQQGLEYVLSQLQKIESVRIEVSGAEGTLAGPLSFAHAVVDHDSVRIEADGVRGIPTVVSFLAGRIGIVQASIDRVEVTLKDRGPQPVTELHFLPAWLGISAHDVTVRQVGVRLVDGTRLHAASVRGDVRMTRWRIDVSPFVVEDAAGRLDGEVYLRATTPLGLRGNLAGHWRLPDGQEYRFAAASHGKLDRTAFDAVLVSPARVSFSGLLLGLDAEPRAIGTLHVFDFDGSPWLAPGRLPVVSGSIAVDAGTRGIGIDGTLTSTEAGTEAIRVHGSGRYAGDRLDLVAFRAWMPGTGASLKASGSIGFEGHAPRLAISGEWTQLRWPLSGEPTVTSRTGSVRLDGAMPYTFQLTAEALGPGLPAADFTARGRIDRDQLAVDRIDSNFLHGRLSGSGRLSFGDDRAWQALVDGHGLDLSLLRGDLSGLIDIQGRIEGRGFSADGPWKAQLAKLSGELRGRPITGSGTIAYGNHTYDLKGVRIVNAGSRVDIDGQYGEVMNLRWNATLESLALLHPSLGGQVESSGTLRGTLSRPVIQGDLDARRLQVGDIKIASAQASVDLDPSDQRDSRVLIQAGNMTVGTFSLDTIRLDASGLTTGHRMSLVLDSPGGEGGRLPGFKAKLAASGSADVEQRSWAGTLEEASIEFTDGNARLASHVALHLGPDLAQATPLCLVTGDARLCAEGEWHRAAESWRVLFSAQDWPLRRLLTSLLGRREFDGVLQASGWAEQQPGHDWVGGLAVIIDKPTLEIRRNRFRSDTVEIGDGRLDVYADEDVLRATAELDLEASTQLTGRASAERHRGVPLLQLPLAGEIRAESAALSTLPLFIPEIDRADGRMEAAVHLGGTLGDPSADGDFSIRDGRLDLYRTNLSLTAVSLDGRFAGDKLTFDGRAVTGKSPVTIEGRFSWPDGVMTGSMWLTGENLLVADTPDYRVRATPDLTVTVGAGGYVVTGQIAIPWARISPRDLSTSVGTSTDERVVGAEAVAEQPITSRVRARVTVALGEDVRVETYGLKAHLGGEVAVSMDPGEETRGTGEIRVLDGEYKTFGVYVKIVKGVLKYDDAPLNLPSLDLEARREIKDMDVVVSVNVRGRIDNPFVTITSDPAMPSSEALSYLLTGRSLNTLQSGEAASVNRAADSLAVSGGGLLLGGVGERLGLDEVSVEGSNANDTQVVLGKFLSPKLFVSYGVSIAEAINTIKLRYTLNPRWALKAEAGLEQSADVEFKIER
jgi:translocation and assembly module TamB